jgi:deoxyxylulose-5-phosphate synthase
MRSCEQVRTAVCYQNLPVRLFGTVGGRTSGGGSTHNAMEDIAIMKSFVNMTVISIGDPNMIRDVLTASMTYPGPMFIRLAQGKQDRVIYAPGSIKVEIGKGITARPGKDATIFAHGELVYQALEAAKALEAEGIDVRVIDMFTIKPIDKEIILRAVEETGRIVVLEDHLAYVAWRARWRTYWRTRACIRRRSSGWGFRRCTRASAAARSCGRCTGTTRTRPSRPSRRCSDGKRAQAAVHDRLRRTKANA